MTAQFAVIGDVIGSRAVPDRRALHTALTAALGQVNDTIAASGPLTVTVGDEFQGSYGRLGEALAATVLVRLSLAPDADARFGIGRGPITVLEQDGGRVVQDGPGWWAAREAIEAARADEQSPTGRGVHTVYRAAGGDQSPAPDLINALLITRDLAISRLSPRSLTILRDLLSDRSQTMVAKDLGISQSAVSQIAARDGLYAIRAAHRLARDLGGDS